MYFGAGMYFWWIGTAIWVLADAKEVGISRNRLSGIGKLVPWGWFLLTLLVWIVGFPLYWYCRGQAERTAAMQAAWRSPSVGAGAMIPRGGIQALDDLEKLAALKDRGLVSQSEFETKKKQLLGL